MLGPALAYRGRRKHHERMERIFTGQAVIADGYAKTMTTAETIKEFADTAESFRHDADLEDENPTCKY